MRKDATLNDLNKITSFNQEKIYLNYCVQETFRIQIDWVLLGFVCLSSSSLNEKSPATAVADGDDTDRPLGPEIALATGFEEATPPTPAIAIPSERSKVKNFFQLTFFFKTLLGLACAIEDSSEISRAEGRRAKRKGKK